MKKRRRIEITVFRRRTTIVLRDKLQGDPIEPPPRHVDAPHPARADSPQAEGADLSQRQATQPSPGGLKVQEAGRKSSR